MITNQRRLRIAGLALFALVAGATGASQAQREVYTSNCCVPAQRQIITSAPSSWTLQLPNGQMATPVQETSLPSVWAPAIGASHWIGPAANTTGPGGNYTYTYSFCLCSLPKGVSRIPAAMYLTILADDGFRAYLNGNSFLNPTGSTYATPISGSPAPSHFVPGLNHLVIVVKNYGGTRKNPTSTPTGLDVSGWIAGYFGSCGPPINRPMNNNQPEPPR